MDGQDEDSVENKEDKECGQLWPCIFFFFFFKVHQQEITKNKGARQLNKESQINLISDNKQKLKMNTSNK